LNMTCCCQLDVHLQEAPVTKAEFRAEFTQFRIEYLKDQWKMEDELRQKMAESANRIKQKIDESTKEVEQKIDETTREVEQKIEDTAKEINTGMWEGFGVLAAGTGVAISFAVKRWDAVYADVRLARLEGAKSTERNFE
jgi:ElaB/YqjD/DUF883 family membrane-anchored ribosome-binding protein